MKVAILLSGGSGSRAGYDIPKQYVRVNGKPVISYCLDTFRDCQSIDSFIIVAEKCWQDEIVKCMDEEKAGEKFSGFALPGRNRQLSIYNGLKKLEGEVDSESYVMIHDAARPLLSVKDIDDYFAAATGHEGLLPVLPMKDTIYYCEDGNGVTGLLDRSKLFAGQAPEIFLFEKYLDANEDIFMDLMKINGSTEPAIMAGMDIVTVPGDERNFKLTTKSDFERFESIVLSEDKK